MGAVARPRSQHELIRLKVCPSLTVIHFLAHADYQAVSSAGLAEAQRKTATQYILPSGRLLLDAYFFMYCGSLDNEVRRREHAETSSPFRRSHFSTESERRISYVFINIILHYLNLKISFSRRKDTTFFTQFQIISQKSYYLSLLFLLRYQALPVLIKFLHTNVKKIRRCHFPL